MTNQKILVIQTAFPGDAILTLPMIQKLKEKFPDSIIDVLAIPDTTIIFKHSKYVNEVITYDKRGKQKSILSLISFISDIKKRRYNKIYSPHRSFRSSLIVKLSGVKETFGFDISSISWVYKNKIRYYKDRHEVARNLDLIGVNTDNDNWKIFPEVSVDEKTSVKIDSILAEYSNKKIIAIAPGSVWETKKYPKEYFVEISKRLTEKKYFILLIGGPKDLALCDEIKIEVDSNIESFAGELNIIESIELLKRCELLICNDSAPTHMGMCAGIKVLTIYCSTVPSFGFYPYNNQSSFASYDDLDCKPCGIHGHQTCPVKTFDCGIKLTPEVVINKILLMLS